MPPTRRCPVCREVMYGRDDRYEAHGYWTVYMCRNGRCPNTARRGWPYQEKRFVSQRRS